MGRKVFLDFVGCRLNQAEIEQMGRQFASRGDEIVDQPGLADLVVVNTCAVTSKAAKSSRNLIRRAARANTDVEIVATGCYTELAPEKVERLPNVRLVVSNADKDSLVPLVLGEAVGDSPAYDDEPISREPLAPGTLGRTRAFVKVQDGCDNRCTFCVTTIARGAGQSRDPEAIIEEIRMLVATGYREVVLTGVHLGSYGKDTPLTGPSNERFDLYHLVRAILLRTDVPRLRLSSLEPWDLSPAFFELWEDERMCPHLHLPLQSGCDAILRRMARRTTQEQFSALVAAARARIPDVAITTDVMAGFPGETDKEFAESLMYVKAMDFAKLHVFPYSARPGTAAARMDGKVPQGIIKERVGQLITYSEGQWAAFCLAYVGREVDVLWESARGATPDGFVWSGLAGNYLRVEAVSPDHMENAISRVQVTGTGDGYALGQIIAG